MKQSCVRNNLQCISHVISVYYLAPNMASGEGSIRHLPMACPNEAIVCLPNGTWAPSVTGTPVQRQAAFTLLVLVLWQRGVQVLTSCASFCMLWGSSSNTTVQHGSVHLASQALLAHRKCAVAFPSLAWTGSRTYVCVVRNVGWVCIFAAQQL